MKPEADPREADDIVQHARTRALGSRPGMRLWAVVLWAGFLGGICSTVSLLLVPTSWFNEPMTFAHLAALFLGAWATSLIPALAAAVLLMPLPKVVRQFGKHDR